MEAPFVVALASEHRNVEPGAQSLWVSLAVKARGAALEATRAPLAVALVVDCSGSMKGSPLEHVLSSTAMLAELLNEQDQLAVITFSTQAALLSGLVNVNGDARARLRSLLQSVEAHGNTNLQSGMGVAAAVLKEAPEGLRRVMVVMSDGQPNVGLTSAQQLADYTATLGVGVSTLGFGLHHDENVLDAIATAGSGRYAYIPDPASARVEVARAALAHGGVVADQLQLSLKLEPGVEVVQLLPNAPLKVGAGGLSFNVGDVFVDQERPFALELALKLESENVGRLLSVVVSGRGRNGDRSTATAELCVDVRAGTRVVDAAAQQAILLVQADFARVRARAEADRGSMPGAAALLRAVLVRVEGLAGAAANDGSPLAELREQLIDEIASYERRSSDLERTHQRKASVQFKGATQVSSATGVRGIPLGAALVGLGGISQGLRFELRGEGVIGRSSLCDAPIQHSSLSRAHARIRFLNGAFVLEDLGSTNGTRVNGAAITSCQLRFGDLVDVGDASFRFERS
jgi:Ca-activated chloride channel family protein